MPVLTRRGLLLGAAALGGFGHTLVLDSAAASAAESVRNMIEVNGSGPAPVRIGRPFLPGEIRGQPQAVAGGARLPTQANVKTRWPDGSVQHAVLAFVLPQGSATVAFVDAPADEGAALSPSQMLAPEFDFDAEIAITFAGQTQRASARAMLQRGDYTVWTAGPIATTVVIADHSAARRWDLGPAPLRPFRPIFHATFWPALRRVDVRAIGEIANTEALSDLQYDLTVSGGLRAPRQVFAQQGVPHYAGTRWARRFWIGGDGAPNIDHNLRYLVATRALANFDTSLRASGKGLGADAQHWADADKSLYGPGLWTQRMGNTGGRGDLGPYTAWVARWLLSFDAQQFAVIQGQADLAGAWTNHVREGNPAKHYDAEGRVPAIGRPVSVKARPTEWLLEDRGNAAPQDKVHIQGPRLHEALHTKPNGGWIAEGAHTPDPYSTLYLLTGDPYHLEQLQFWVSMQIMRYNPAARGPAGAAGIHDQTRGDAWSLRDRASVAWLTPDATPEKRYYADAVSDAIALWEGVHGVRGTAFENTPLWLFGSRKQFESPLHVFEDNATHGYDGLKQELVSTEQAVWQNYLLIFELGRAKELGYPTGAMLSWLAVVLTGQFQDPDYDPDNLMRYFHPVRDAQGRFYQRWSEMVPAFKQPRPPTNSERNVGDGYAVYAYGASTMILQEPGGQKAYEWLRDRVWDPNRGRFADDPKWAYLPRA